MFKVFGLGAMSVIFFTSTKMLSLRGRSEDSDATKLKYNKLANTTLLSLRKLGGLTKPGKCKRLLLLNSTMNKQLCLQSLK